MIYFGSLIFCFFEKLTSKINLKLLKQKINIGNLFFFICSLYLILICGLRSVEVGRDGVQYYNFYIQARNLSFNELANSWQQSGLEKGFLVIEHLFSHVLRLPYNVFLLFTSFLSIFPPMLLIKKYSKNTLFSVLLYLFLGMYFFSLSGIRQSVSMGFLCLAYIFIDKSKLFMSLIMTCIAVTFHISSIVFILVFLFKKFKINKFVIIIIFISIIFSFIIGEYIFNFITNLINLEYEKIEDSGGFGTYFFILFIYLVSISFTPKNIEKSRNYSLQFLMISLFLIIWPVVRFNASTFRLVYIFQLFLIIFVPNLIYKISRKDIKLCVLFLILIVSVIYFKLYVYNDYNMYIDYKFYWQ